MAAVAEGFILVTFAFHREGRAWVGICEELGTAASGRTLEHATEELDDLVLLQLNMLEQEGEREHFFQQNNIRFYTDHMTEAPPTIEVRPLDGVGADQYLLLRKVRLPSPWPPGRGRRSSVNSRARKARARI